MNYFSIKVLSTVMKQGEDKTSRMYYASSALTYLLAMVCSNMALQWVNYPTQVIIKKHPKYYLQLCAVVLMVSFTICICAYMIYLIQVVGKSCKPIPVMILGVLFGNKSYPMAKYLFILTVVLGVAMFMYKDKPVTAKQEVESGIGMGEILLVSFLFGSNLFLLVLFSIPSLFQILSLIMDGLTGAIQERMKTEYQSKSGHMMLHMNLWSVGYLAFGKTNISLKLYSDCFTNI